MPATATPGTAADAAATTKHIAESSALTRISRSVRGLISRLFTHEHPRVVCPPGPLPRGQHPPIVVSSLMRSGTHLTMDLLLNNFREYRREPFYVDFDQYVFRGHDRMEMEEAGSCLIKTHAGQRPFDDEVCDLLRALGSRGAVIIPERPLSEVQKSLHRWNVPISRAALERAEERQNRIWEGQEVMRIPFASLLDPQRASLFLSELRERLNLEEAYFEPVMPASSTGGVLWDKLLTRMRRSKARRLNTTIGYKLRG